MTRDEAISNLGGNRNKTCFCDSGKKLKHCHYDALSKLKSKVVRENNPTIHLRKGMGNTFRSEDIA